MHYGTKTPRENITNIIDQHLDTTVRKIQLFGSQAQGTTTSTSDYSVAITGPIPLPYATKRKIKIDLHESPYRVDIIDTRRVSHDFLAIAGIQSPK